METSFHVLGYLFGRFEVHFVDSILIEFAISRGIVAANLWAGVIDPAPVVRLQMLAVGVYQQIPSTILNKNGRSIVQQIPADEVQILLARGSIDGQREIATTFCGAVFAKRSPLWDLFSRWLLAIDRFCRQKLDWLWKCGGAHKIIE